MKRLVSLGMSCQTTHQLSYFAEQYPQLVRVVKTPFDWLICSPASAADWLNEDLREFDQSDIVEYRGYAYWSYFKIWFWHGFFDRTGPQRVLDVPAFTEHELSKLRYTRENFRSIDVAKTVFVLSNTQNNLTTEVYQESEREHFAFSENNIDKLQTALNNYFDRPVRLHVVSRPDRCTPALSQRENVHSPGGDNSDWKGNRQAWAEILKQIIERESG